MTSPAINRFMNNARVHLPGALDSAIQQEFFNVLDDFCQKSKIWQEEIEVNIETGETEYEIVASEPGTIVSLISFNNSNGIPVACSMATPGTIVLDAEPSNDDTCTAIVSLTVVDPTAGDYPQFPEWLLQNYFTGLVDGVVGRMMAQPAKPYSNERMAIYRTRLFNDARARARSEASKKNLHGGQAWRFPQSFAPCRR